jgi:hypothetical protein
VGGWKEIKDSRNPMCGTKTCDYYNMIKDGGMNYEGRKSWMLEGDP